MVEPPRYLSNRYEMGNLLGAGGMAEVYDGHDRVLARRVAIKVLYPQYTRNPAFVARFKREAQAAASLAHPNVVGVFDTGEHENTHFTVMEYVEGKTVATLIDEQGGPLPFDQVVHIAMDVCSALAAAHARGLIHRDVKPANIMVTPRGQVKVMDFGIARAISAGGPSLTETAGVVGTARYMSPEQAQAGQVDERSDIYSLGVTLYECLTGQVPFDGDSPVAVAARHISEAPRPPSELVPQLPPSLQAITLKALAKDPAHRYQSAEELRDDLERAINGEPVAAQAPGDPSGAYTAGAFGANAPMGQPGQGPPAMGAPTGTGTFSGTYGPGNFAPGASGTYAPGTFGPATSSGTYGAGTYGNPAAYGAPGTYGGPAPDPFAAGSPPTGFQYDYADTNAGRPAPDGAPGPYEDFDQPRRRFRPMHLVGIAGAMLLLFAAVAYALPDREEQNPGGQLASTQGIVPNVRGQSEQEARAAIAAAGLEAQAEAIQQPDAEVPEGSAIGTEPQAGSSAFQGEPIVLIVSTGARGVEVPSLVGQTLDEARQAAEAAGFNVRVTREASEGPSGVIIAQNPEGSGRVEEPGDLLLVVSSPIGDAATTSTTTTTVAPTTTTIAPTTTVEEPTTTVEEPATTEEEEPPAEEDPPAEDPPAEEDPPDDTGGAGGGGGEDPPGEGEGEDQGEGGGDGGGEEPPPVPGSAELVVVEP